MNVFSRVVAVIAGVVLLVVAAVGLAHEIALLADLSFFAPFADPWRPVFEEPSWATTGVAAIVATVVGILLLWLAVAAVGRRRNAPALLTFEGEHGKTSVDVSALEHALRRRLEASVRDMRVKGFEFDTSGVGCRVRVEADLPATDLAGVQRQAMLVVRGDLERTAGLRVDAVDIVVGRLLPPSGK